MKSREDVAPRGGTGLLDERPGADEVAVLEPLERRAIRVRVRTRMQAPFVFVGEDAGRDQLVAPAELRR